MTFSTPPMDTGTHADPPIERAGDDHLRAAVLDAELPPLLAALAQVTGDTSLLDPALRPQFAPSAAGAEPQGGMSEAAQDRARRLAVEALRALRERGGKTIAQPDSNQLQSLMEFMTGEIDDEYVELLGQELGLPVDVGAPGWRKQDVAPDTEFTVAIIGAGMSGLAAAHRLAQADIPFVVFEKNPDVGGVWYENTYPGCRLDTSNFAYSYSFAQKPDWPQQFSLQGAIQEYFSDVADDFDIRPKIEFETEVSALTFDDESLTWELEIRDADGDTRCQRFQAVISAVGQLNRPKYPDIPGRETFDGHAWHSGHWNHDVDLKGLRVAVVGTGASAYQIAPSIVDEVGEMAIFQRTPPWMLPTPTYHDDIPPGMRWLLENVPFYGRWFRFWQFWTSVEGRRPFVQVDPDNEHEIAVSGPNEDFRQALVTHLESQFGDDPELLENVTPDYPPGAKRMLRDNGVWARTLKMDHVDLVTENIERITPTGIVTTDGVSRNFDVLIYATGFNASDFLAPMRVQGRDGRDLHAEWKGDARAYLGINVPGYPNLFCLYGPNTNLVVNGSIILFSEAAVHYTIECLRMLLERGGGALDVRREVFDTYNEEIDRGNREMAWGASDVNSWYKNASGRVSQNWPFTLLEYWKRTRHPSPEAYEYL